MPVTIEGHPQNREIELAGSIPDAVLARYPTERKHDDPAIQFFEDLAGTVADALGDVVRELDSGTQVGVVEWLPGGDWVFRPDEDLLASAGDQDDRPGRGPPGPARLTVRGPEGDVKLQLERGDAVRVDYYNTIAKNDDTVRGVIERIGTAPDDEDTALWLTGDVSVTGLTERSRVIIDGRSRGLFRGIHRLFGPDVPADEDEEDTDDDGPWSVDALAAAIENVAAAGEPTVTRQAGRATIDFKLPVASDAPFASSLEYDPDEGHITGLALRFSPALLEHTSDQRLEDLFDGILDRTDPPGGTVWTSYSEGDARETGPHILAPGGFSELDPDEVVLWLDRVLAEYRRVFE